MKWNPTQCDYRPHFISKCWNKQKILRNRLLKDSSHGNSPSDHIKTNNSQKYQALTQITYQKANNGQMIL